MQCLIKKYNIGKWILINLLSCIFFIFTFCTVLYASDNNIWVDYHNYIYNYDKTINEFLTGWQYLLDENTLTYKVYIFDENGTLTTEFTPIGTTINEKAASLAEQMYNSKLFIYDSGPRGRDDIFSFDCSSFIGRIYKLLGNDFYSTNHTTYLQNKYFIKEKKLVKDLINLKKGDIIYYGSDNENTNHCAIITNYTSNGYEIISCKGGNTQTLSKEILKYNDDILHIVRP